MTEIAKEGFKYLGWFLLCVFLWVNGCKKKDTTKIITPDILGKFEPNEPKHETIYVDKLVVRYDSIFVKNPTNTALISENERLKYEFEKANDSIKKLLYSSSIKINKFSTNFEDENMILNIDGIVQGEVKEITPNYKIKERKSEIQIKSKETVLRVLFGGSIGLNKELNQGVYSFDLNFQNRKGDVFSGEYLNLGGQEFGMIGFKKSILNFKK